MWISRKRWELAKMLKCDFYRSSHLPSNGTIANVVLPDRYLNFRGQFFKWPFWLVIAGKMHTLLLSSDRKSAIRHRMALLRTLYNMTLNYIFNVKFWKVNISITMRASENDQLYFYRGWYLQLNGTFANLVLHDLDPYFQGQTWLFWQSKADRLLPSDRKSDYLHIEWRHCWCCT